MKGTKYLLAMALCLAAVMLPSAVLADDIVDVTVSNLTINGRSVCGSSGTSLCSEVFNSSFLWDNTTSTVVSGSLQFSSTGPLGSFGVILGPVFDAFGPDVVVTAQDSFTDIFSFHFDLSGQTLTPGTYPLQQLFTPGAMTSGLTCEGDPCITDFAFAGLPPPVAVNASSVTATVTAAPEPTSAVLLGTSLLGLVGKLGFYRKRRLS